MRSLFDIIWFWYFLPLSIWQLVYLHKWANYYYMIWPFIYLYTNVCLDQCLPWQRSASTNVHIDQCLPWQMCASTNVCLDQCLPWQRSALTNVCHDKGPPQPMSALTKVRLNQCLPHQKETWQIFFQTNSSSIVVIALELGVEDLLIEQAKTQVEC